MYWVPWRSFWLEDRNLTSPNDYTERYARMVATLGSRIEVRVGSHTQDLPIFVRMLDKDSEWVTNTRGYTQAKICVFRI